MKYKEKVWILFSLCCGCIFSSCKEKKQSVGNTDYKTMTISIADATLYSYYSASIMGEQNVEVRPQISGMITEICINEGAHIKKGDPLFVIDQVPYKAAVATAVANVKSAQAKVATAELTRDSRLELLRENVISEFELQTAQNNLQEAEATLAQARAEEVNACNNLSYTVIKSPVDGVASMIPYKVGTLVHSSISNPLVTVSSEDKMYAYFSITENQLLELTKETGNVTDMIKSMPPVDLLLSNGEPYELKGEIDAISGTVDTQTGSIGVRAAFKNPKHLLRNGGSARIVIPYRKPNCIIIPKSATFEIQDKVYVYKVIHSRTATAQITPFKISEGTHYVVESGLDAGDVIIAEGVGLLREGTLVRASNNRIN